MLLRNLRTFASLTNPHFRLYFANNIVGQVSMNMQGMARPLLIYEVTGSAALLGVTAVVGSVPMILLSPIGGALADRVKKKYVVLCGGLWSVFMALLVAVLLTLGFFDASQPASRWILIAACSLDGVGAGLCGPSYQAMIREIVGAEEVMNALAVSSVGQNLLRIAIPLVTGVIISALGYAIVFYLVAGLVFFGNIFIALIPATPPQAAGGGGARRAWTDIAEGFRYVLHERTLFLVLGLMALVAVLSMPCGVLMPVFADDILKVGATGMGRLMSASGVGATIVSVILASMPNKRRGIMLLVATLFGGITLTVFSFSTIWYLSLVVIFFMGMADTVRQTLGNTLLLYYAEHEYWGRVVSVQAMVFGVSGMGALVASVLAGKIGVQWAAGGFAIALIAVPVAMVVLSPRLRRLN